MSESAARHTTPPEHRLPHGEFEHEGRLKIVIANIDKNVRTQAIEAANARLNEELGEGGFSKKFLKNIWKGNMAREYYLSKYTNEAERQIREHENLLHHDETGAEEYQVATTMRLAQEYDEMLHHGEKRTKLSDTNKDGSENQEARELKQHVFKLIEDYANGTIGNEAAFQEEKKRVVTTLVQEGLAKEFVGEGLLYADNLLQIAQNVKSMVEHRRATGEDVNAQEVLANADVVLGEARLGARTEVVHNRVERITKKLESKGFLNEGTVATAVSVVYSIAGWASKSAISSASKLAGVSVAAGAFAGMREARMLKEERAQHAREMAVGKGSAENLTGRRQDLETARYETKTADALIDQIGILYDHEGTLRITDKASYDNALQMIAECQARIELSDTKNVDLISFSNVGQVETERFKLDMALAKAKCDIRRFLHEADDDELKGLGIAEGDLSTLRDDDKDPLDFVLATKVDANTGLLVEGGEDHEGINQKDRIYRKLRNKRVAAAFAKGTLLGSAIGIAAQEGAAFALSSQQGALESLVGLHDTGVTRETLLEGFFSEPQHAFELSGTMGAAVALGEYTKLNLPEEFHISHTGDTLTVTGPEGMKLEGIGLTPDGHLTAEAAQRLEAAGFHLNYDASVVAEPVMHETTVNANEFLQHHSGETTHVTRDFWYDNGTPSLHQAEGSELGMHYNGLNSEGHYVVSISGMDGHATSSSGGEISWREAAANGELKVALSLSKGTQADFYGKRRRQWQRCDPGGIFQPF